MNMKRILAGVVAVALGSASFHAQAQDEAQQQTHQILTSLFPYLSSGELDQFEKDLSATFAKDPSLRTEGADLFANRTSTSDLLSDRKDMKAYEARLRGSMVKDDPSVSAIFDKIDAHVWQAQR